MKAITVLVDNTANGDLHSEHGLSFWIECDGKHLLFDTGQTNIIASNAAQIGVDLADTNAVILSHGHYDHAGGIPSVFRAAKNASLYLHPKSLEAKYSRKSDRVNTVGIQKDAREVIESMTAKDKVVRTEKPLEILPGLFVTGQIPRENKFEDTGGDFFLDKNCSQADPLSDDQALFFETEKGLVVVLGCGHAGVVNTLDYICKLTSSQKIHTLIGGLHLVNASDERICKTIEVLEKYKIANIGPAHCTGKNAQSRFKSIFAERYFVCAAGLKMNF